jgi:hypothetical protein
MILCVLGLGALLEDRDGCALSVGLLVGKHHVAVCCLAVEYVPSGNET